MENREPKKDCDCNQKRDRADGPTGHDDEAMVFPRKLSLRHLWPGVLAAAIALLGIPFAEKTFPSIYQFLRHLPLRGFYASATQFPSPTIVILMLGILFIRYPGRRRTIVYFLAALACSSSINEPLKYLTSRARPDASIIMSDKDMARIEKYLKTHPQCENKTRAHGSMARPVGGQIAIQGRLCLIPLGPFQ